MVALVLNQNYDVITAKIQKNKKPVFSRLIFFMKLFLDFSRLIYLYLYILKPFNRVC